MRLKRSSASVAAAATDGNDRLVGTNRAEILAGEAGDDWIYGRGGDDTLDGGDGDDRLDGGLGFDRLIGGLGNDTYILATAGDRVTEALDAGRDTVRAAMSYTLTANVETLLLVGGALDGTGNGLANVVVGNAAANRLDGRGGADRMSGGDGDDRYIVDDGGDIVREAVDGGLDTVESRVSHRLGANVENLTLLGARAIDGTGNSLFNHIVGNSADNVLDGGVPVEDAHGGNDILEGGAGNDTYVLHMIPNTSGSSDTIIIEAAGQGIDTILTDVRLQGELPLNVENLTMFGNEDVDADGNPLSNRIVGNGGTNALDGKGGEDTLIGGAGDDIYMNVNAAGADTVIERAGGGHDAVYAVGTYVLAANVEDCFAWSRDVRFTGNGLDNFMGGSSGEDVLVGGAGEDWLSGRAGADVLTGGTGTDKFSFSYVPDGQVDRITDFHAGSEKIVLWNDFIPAGPAGSLAAGAFRTGTAAQDADDRIIYNKANGNIWFDADGNGSGEAVLLARVDAGLALAHTNFEVA
jgi:Ca2+-binding RTX toxin-like protein